jgi:hypothetical protein
VSDARIPAHLEVGGLIRAVDAAGGFATVLATGERDAGTILVVCCENGANAAAYERLPQADGTRAWTRTREQDAENPQEFWEFCRRRHDQDPDLWVLELDIPHAERFIDSTGTLN